MYQEQYVLDKKKKEEKKEDRRLIGRLVPGVDEDEANTKVHQRRREPLGKHPSAVKQVRTSGWGIFGLKGGGPNPGNAFEEEKLMAVEDEGVLADVNLEVSSDFYLDLL